MADVFHTTVWSRIADAQDGQESAIEQFVARYRTPVVKFIRNRGGHLAEDAEDLAQEVFVRLLTRDVLARADKERGRFRAFLVGVCKNVIREEIERRSAKKRGGGNKPLPLSEVPEPVMAPPDDAEFNRLWAEQLLAQALLSLKAENPRQHRTLILRFQEDLSAGEIAERLDRNVQQVRNDLHRARKRLSRFVKNEIANYASSREELDEELAMFLSVAGLGGDSE